MRVNKRLINFTNHPGAIVTRRRCSNAVSGSVDKTKSNPRSQRERQGERGHGVNIDTFTFISHREGNRLGLAKIKGRTTKVSKDTLNLMSYKERRGRNGRVNRERKKAKRKGRDGEASNPGPKDKKCLKIQQINITNMDKNGHALVDSEADVIGVAEHKLRGENRKKWRNTITEAKRKLVIGPCEEEGKLPKAGVGFIVKDNLTVIEGKT